MKKTFITFLVLALIGFSVKAYAGTVMAGAITSTADANQNTINGLLSVSNPNTVPITITITVYKSSNQTSTPTSPLSGSVTQQSGIDSTTTVTIPVDGSFGTSFDQIVNVNNCAPLYNLCATTLRITYPDTYDTTTALGAPVTLPLLKPLVTAIPFLSNVNTGAIASFSIGNLLLK